MIFVKVTTTSRKARPRPFYLKGEGWSEVYRLLMLRAMQHDGGWYDVRLHTVSESEYNKYTHPQF